MPADILVIDDTPANLQLVTYLLESSGHNVIGADTAEAGIALAHDRHPDLIVLDIQLPDIDGYEALDRMRSDPSVADTPVVAVTAFAMTGDRQRAADAGFDGFVTKPVDPYTFVASLTDHLPTARR
jgi:CheY-like chemotaxis protein